MEQSQPKWVGESKTIWVNLITLALAILMAVESQQWISDNPSAAASITAAIAVLNIILRSITVVPVGFRKP